MSKTNNGMKFTDTDELMVTPVGAEASGGTATANPGRIAGVARPLANKQTRTNGQVADITTDENENLWTRESYAPGYEDNANNVAATADKPVVGAAYSNVLTRGFTGTTYQNAKASPGALGGFYVTNANVALRYLLLVNATGAPSGSTGVIASIPIPAGTALVPGVVQLSKAMLGNFYMSTAVTVAVSTADGTFTAATAADHTLHVWSS